MGKVSKLQKISSYKLWQINNQRQNQLKTVLAPFKLTYREYVFLYTLAFEMPVRGGSPAQKYIARRANMSKLQVSRLARSLEMRSHIRRVNDFFDGRAYNVRIMPETFSLIRQVQLAIEEFERTTSYYVVLRDK